MPASTLLNLPRRSSPAALPAPEPGAGQAARLERASAMMAPWKGPAPFSEDAWLEPAIWNSKRVHRRVAQLVGDGGHRALLHRALAGAAGEIAWLSAISVSKDGRLSGLEAVLPPRTAAERQVACLTIREQYVGLLLKFLGEELTRKLVRDDWPELLPASGEPTSPALASDTQPSVASSF